MLISGGSSKMHKGGANFEIFSVREGGGYSEKRFQFPLISAFRIRNLLFNKGGGAGGAPL